MRAVPRRDSKTDSQRPVNLALENYPGSCDLQIKGGCSKRYSHLQLERDRLIHLAREKILPFLEDV